jgi:hypothetical protein
MAVSFSLPIIFAILDIFGAGMWAQVGGWEGEAYTIAGQTYQGLFWGFAYILVAVMALTYYLITKDKSESLALLLVPYILLQFGVEDVIFYWFSGLNVFAYTMPWLEWNLIPVTILSYIFNEGIISGRVLLTSALIGFLLAFKTAEVLLKKKW